MIINEKAKMSNPFDNSALLILTILLDSQKLIDQLESTGETPLIHRSNKSLIGNWSVVVEVV